VLLWLEEEREAICILVLLWLDVLRHDALAVKSCFSVAKAALRRRYLNMRGFLYIRFGSKLSEVAQSFPKLVRS
jgi:hypothetical protein